jgi:hypothetical protein
MPPDPPLISATGASLSADDQATGHLVSEAWREFETGQTGPAYRRLHALALRRPTKLSLWKAVLIMNMKTIARRLQ